MATFRRKPAVPKPFLAPAMEAAVPSISEAVAKALDEAMRRPSLFSTMAKTPSIGKVHSWSTSYSKAHWRFGVVLRPAIDSGIRAMSLGDNTAIILNGMGIIEVGTKLPFLTRYWEPVE